MPMLSYEIIRTDRQTGNSILNSKSCDLHLLDLDLDFKDLFSAISHAQHVKNTLRKL